MNYRNISLLLLTFCFLALAPSAQAQYGKEWIVSTQEYYKIEVGENHIYTIDYAALVAAGIPVNSINPKNFQLYKNGEEQYIYVAGQADDNFGSTDFIEFYGEKNDGKLDAPLYLTPEQQPHQYMSLYQDTTNYYLTWSATTPGKRITDFYNGNYNGKTSDAWLWYESVIYFSDGPSHEFYDGSPYSSPGYLSEYSEGEGWFGQYIARGQAPVVNVNTEQYNSSGPNPKLSFAVYGKSNPQESVNGQNHRIEVSIGSDILYEKTHSGYTRIETGLNAPEVNIPIGSVGATTPVRFNSTYLSRARHAASYVKIEYPRNLNIDNKTFFEFDYQAVNDHFEFTNFNGTSATIFDLKNNRRIKGDISAGTLRFNSSATGPKKIAIVDDASKKAVSASGIKLINFDPIDYSTTDYDYIIVTHPKLQQSALEYKAYRESAKGGSFNVYIAYMPDIYEKYYYGLKHPIALKNFCKDIYTSQTNKPKHLLLLGKGQSYFLTRFNYTRRTFENLVPTWGEPGSDYPFVTDYTPNNLAPVMGIGRIPARTDEDVRKYLYKLKLHEEFGNNTKKVLFLTGGIGASEQFLLQGKQRTYYTMMKGKKFGAAGIFIEKKEAEPIDQSLITDIQRNIDNGLSTVSYFGHGASQVLEIDIGKPNQLDNEGKYPLFVFNGCALGNTYSDISLPEEFLFEEKKGGVAWIASSAYGFIDPLANWTSIFYENLFKRQYGKTIGEVIALTTDEYQDPSNNFNRSQCRQITYHGDPAIRLYSPEKPDFQIDPDSNQLFPVNANAELDSVAISMDLKNYGLAEDKEPLVYVSIKYSNDSIRNFGPRSFGPVYNTKKIQFWIPINDFSVGWQTATITIDYGDSIEELSPFGELNNTSNFEYLLPSNSLAILGPKKDDIQPLAEVTLQVQNNNLLRKGNAVIFQIDTTPLFNSSVLQVSEEVIADNIIAHKFVLPPFDSTDFFWRATFAKDIADPRKWKQSTFSLIFQSEKGWSQGHFSKRAKSVSEGIIAIDTLNKLKFKRKIGLRYDIYAGGSNTNWASTGMLIDNIKSTGYYSRNQVELVAVNPDNEKRFSEPNNPYNRTNRSRDFIAGNEYYQIGEKNGVHFYNTRDDAQIDSLIALLNRIPENYYLFLVLNGNVGLENWPDSLFAAIEQFGASKLRILSPGDPYGLIGQKGSEIGSAIEAVANYATSVDPLDQYLPISTQLFPFLTEGSLTSQPIGPSQSWKQFYVIAGNEKDSEADIVYYSLWGTHPDRVDSLILDNITAKTTDISFIDPSLFPYLKVQGHYKDEDRRTPAPQKRWTVLYDGVPEGSLMPDIVFEQTHDTIQEGDSIGFKIAYKNISSFDMDSVLVLAVNIRSNNQRDTIELRRHVPLAPSDSVVFSYKIHTLNLTGHNNFVISVNPDFDQPEEILENNIISLPFFVQKDEKNPLLDVVFDGIHILDFDIVSPSPLITMSVLDENNFIFITDPNAFTATITYLDEAGNPSGKVDSIIHTQPNTNFYPASSPGEKAILEYIPADLQSGKYRLDVAVTDASGNSSSDLNYSINFEVIKESQITNVYPYPNPFTTSMKFVYTLTGEQVPDYMKIQILTVTGKVVREITQNEMGPIRIGNNISEFTWNGTDEFGDQLANGVYLYKVTAKINGEDIQQRETAGDQFFNKGYGKIYLMR